MTVIDWLLDSDPSVRWQVMRDLTGAPAEEVAAERARVDALITTLAERQPGRRPWPGLRAWLRNVWEGEG